MEPYIRPVEPVQSIIPAPERINCAEGILALNLLENVSAPKKLSMTADAVMELCCHFGLTLKMIVGNSKKLKRSITLAIDPLLKKDTWQIVIEKNGIHLTGGGEEGVFYAYTALAQMIASGASCGPAASYLNCGILEDSPRFAWRGFMLDSARHFQSMKEIKGILRLLAQYRFNIFHWHLTDNQAWRIAAEAIPGTPDLSSYGMLEKGQFSASELKEVAEYAKKYHIMIVPEVDVPGHSEAILHALPHLSCFPGKKSKEFCLGNPDGKKFIKKVLQGVMNLFPDSKYIHLGGDEACRANWDLCPKCQAAVKKERFRDSRALENAFMQDLCDFIQVNGRTPIVWGTQSAFTKNVTIQAWGTGNLWKIMENGRGNPVIYSVDSAAYFDYPANDGEPRFSWMNYGLPLEQVCCEDPLKNRYDRLGPYITGVEGCLWTEIVPGWRLFQKIQPRLGALSEMAWSWPENRQYRIYREKDTALEGAGYYDFLRKISGVF